MVKGRAFVAFTLLVCNQSQLLFHERGPDAQFHFRRESGGVHRNLSSLERAETVEVRFYALLSQCCTALFLSSFLRPLDEVRNVLGRSSLVSPSA